MVVPSRRLFLAAVPLRWASQHPAEFTPLSPTPPSSSTQLKALEAADAARRKEAERQAERQRQKAELERQRQERVKVRPRRHAF